MQGGAPGWLGKLVFPRRWGVGSRAERSEERGGTRQVAFRLCDTGLLRQGIDVVRRNIENLIKLSQRFRETTKCDIRNRVLGEQINVARVEPLGFVEVRIRSGPTGLACARHKPAIQESGCYSAGTDVLAQSNALRCRNPFRQA